MKKKKTTVDIGNVDKKLANIEKYIRSKGFIVAEKRYSGEQLFLTLMVR